MLDDIIILMSLIQGIMQGDIKQWQGDGICRDGIPGVYRLN